MNIFSILYISTQEGIIKRLISTKDGSLIIRLIKGIWSQDYLWLLILLKPSQILN